MAATHPDQPVTGRWLDGSNLSSFKTTLARMRALRPVSAADLVVQLDTIEVTGRKS